MSNISLADELVKLQHLRDAGVLSDEEYRWAKARLFTEGPPEREARQWALFIHLSQFASYILPMAGIILPIVLWQIKKDELPGIDAHARVVLNWIISVIIYILVCIPLCLVLIGIPLLFVLFLAIIIMPIVGGIKANDGVLWKYPGSIPFFTVKEPTDSTNLG